MCVYTCGAYVFNCRSNNRIPHSTRQGYNIYTLYTGTYHINERNRYWERIHEEIEWWYRRAALLYTHKHMTNSSSLVPTYIRNSRKRSESMRDEAFLFSCTRRILCSRPYDLPARISSAAEPLSPRVKYII